MQIILTQAEIEIALRKYVNDQVNIREGHEILIDLKAGRGPEGFTANIDIVPVEQKPKTPGSKPRERPPLQVAKAPVQAALELPPEAAQQDAQDDPPETGTGVAQEVETASESVTDVPETSSDSEGGEAEDASPPETKGNKPKSLFANLGKPRNG